MDLFLLVCGPNAKCFFSIHMGPPFQKRVACAPHPLSWRVQLGLLNLALLTREEGELGATSSQGHAGLGSLRRLLTPLDPLTVQRVLGAEIVWLAVNIEEV